MKKLLSIMILLCLYTSCQDSLSDLSKDEVTHIDVYYVPFDILSPIETTQEHIKSDFHKKIVDRNDIEKIFDKLDLLEKEKGVKFIENGIYLRADFYNSDKEILRLLFDKNSFKIDNNIFKTNENLINYLIKDINVSN